MTRFNFYRPNLFDETNSLFARWDDVVLHTQSKQKRVKHCMRFIMFAHGIRFEWWFYLNAGIARRHSIPTTKIASFHGSIERKQPYLHIHTHTHSIFIHIIESRDETKKITNAPTMYELLSLFLDVDPIYIDFVRLPCALQFSTPDAWQFNTKKWVCYMAACKFPYAKNSGHHLMELTCWLRLTHTHCNRLTNQPAN